MADPMDSFFPKQQDNGIYVYKDPFGKEFKTSANVKPIKTTVRYKGPEQASVSDSLLKFNTSDLGFKVGTNELGIQTPAQDQLDVQKSISSATGQSAANIADQTKFLKEQQAQYKQEKLMVAGAKFGIDILNTMNQYQNVTGVARFNIMQARNQAADALYRGRQAGFQRQSEGQRAGEQALLAMAAQGQSVTGAGVQKIQQSYEAIGMENSMREEINGIREALGFQLEEIGQEYQTEMAKNQAEMSILSSVLEAGASAYGYGAFDGGL